MQRKLSFENFRLDKAKVIMSGHLRCLFLSLGKVSSDGERSSSLAWQTFTIYIWGSRESQPRLVIWLNFWRLVRQRRYFLRARKKKRNHFPPPWIFSEDKLGWGKNEVYLAWFILKVVKLISVIWSALFRSKHFLIIYSSVHLQDFDVAKWWLWMDMLDTIS